MTKEFQPSCAAVAESLLEKTHHYTDARLTSHRELNLYLYNNELRSCTRGNKFGLSVRSITPRFTAFTTTTNPNSETVGKMFNRVERRIDKSGKEDTHLLEERIPKDVRAEFKESDMHRTVEEIVAWMRERIYQPNAETDVEVFLRIIEEKKIFLNSENSRLFFDVVRLYLHVGAFFKSAGNFFHSFDDLGAIGSLENLEDKNLTETTESIAQRASLLSRSHSPSEGMREVILDSKLSGLIAHEIGHMFETDSDTFSPHLLKDICIPKISIKDTGGTKNLYGWTPFDDEGVKSKQISLIREGEIDQNIHTLQTAARMNEEPSGGGRAEEFSTRPRSRMRNTYLTAESEGWSREALFEDSAGALFVVGGEGGIRVGSGHFVFYPEAIYELGKKGSLDSVCLPCSLEGSVGEILGNIDAAGKDVQFFPTYCQSRGQRVPVSAGGSVVRTKLKIGRY